jgi:hypothetical protein
MIIEPLSIRQLEDELTIYEERYGLPSDRLHEAFPQGEPTDDQRRWHMLYVALQAAKKSS